MTSRIETSNLVNHEYQHMPMVARNSQELGEKDDDEDKEQEIDKVINNEEPDNNNNVQQHDEVFEHDHETGINGLHPIELAAHTILNGPLDHLNEDFELLSQSQYILLTRLRLIEDRLQSFKKVIVDDGNMTTEKEISESFNKIRELKKRLGMTVKSLDKVEVRVERMNNKLCLNVNE